MPAWLIPAITGAASIAASAIGKSRTKTLVDREEKLTQIQSDANRSLALFNNQLQMEMWEKTGPKGQMEQLKKAGLNPGLIYGMGGAGGQTAMAAQAAGVGKGSANDRTKGDDALAMGIASMSQIGLMQAQKENIQADTQLKQAEAKKVEGVDTRLGESRIQEIAQGIATSKAQQANTEVQTALANLDKIYKDATLETNIAKATTELETGYANLKTAIAQSDISEASKESLIETYRLAAIEGALRNDLLKVQKRQGESQINVNEAQIQKMAADIAQGWKGLDQGDTKLAIEKFNAVIKANYPGITQVMGKVTNSFIESLFKITTGDNSWKPENMK